MNTINKEGVIYTRVSTNKQANNGNGLEGQYSLPYRLMSNKRMSKNRMVELLVQNWNQLVPFFKRLEYVTEE